MSPASSKPPQGKPPYTITDLINLDKLQQFQDSFARCLKVASTLSNPDGRPITKPSNFSVVCSMLRTTEKGMRNCMSSARHLGDKAREQRIPVCASCCGIGFTDAIAPIFVAGHHIANWVIGQYHTGAVDEQRVQEYAREVGLNPADLVQAFREMPKISTEELDEKLAFLSLMANELSELAYRILTESAQIEELNRTKNELERHRIHLQQLVDERTKDLEQANRQLRKEIADKETILQKQQRLITAIESAVESIVVTSPDGTIIYANPAFSKLTGYTATEIINQNPRILKSGLHEPQFYQDLWQTITAGKVWSGRLINRKKDGTLYHENGTIAPVEDKTGAICNFVAVKHDITRELELEQQLQLSQRLESLGTLAAGLAHEINSPAQYIITNTEYVREALADLFTLQEAYEKLAQTAMSSGVLFRETDAIARIAKEIDIDFIREESAAALGQVIEGSDRIATIVKAMKGFSLRDGAIKRSENLNELISSVVAVSKNFWRQVAELKLELDPDLPEILLYGGKIRDSLLGILANATYAITEKLGAHPAEKGEISITTRWVDDYVELRIADSGNGIPAHLINRIFDPFFTTKPVGKGQGQGLSAAHRVIVTDHGGSMRVSSQQDIGTEFIITLPLTQP